MIDNSTMKSKNFCAVYQDGKVCLRHRDMEDGEIMEVPRRRIEELHNFLEGVIRMTIHADDD